jgi:hypothetical protein
MKCNNNLQLDMIVLCFELLVFLEEMSALHLLYKKQREIQTYFALLTNYNKTRAKPNQIILILIEISREGGY